MSTGKVVLGAVAGIAVGAILGVLFAPDKGSETRRKIRNAGNDYADGLQSKYKEFTNSVSEKFKSALDGAATLEQKVK